MSSEPNKTSNTENSSTTTFKKPILIGKLGRLPRKLTDNKDVSDKNETSIDSQDCVDTSDNNGEIGSDAECNNITVLATPEPVVDNAAQFTYKEPNWSGLPQSGEKNYAFEILKCGTILGSINIMSKPYWVFGRLPNCDVCLGHPTVSRYHAVLQYRRESNQDQPEGFYIYDLGSTHGTFLNKHRVKAKMYIRVQVGHMLRLGCSTRSYLLIGPEEDTEQESELSVTELKQKRAAELLRREEAAREAELRREREIEEKRKKDEERGVDWGMGEDADEETDLAENPYAQTNNEELYLDDPKKALRGFMEREGFDLEYDCNEQGIGHFLCKVVLPIDDDRGRPIVAEALHKGKKKEAVVQCALEACRILDRHGLLRQAKHESRKRKAKNWEEDDYYDSDDDTYLDRTGTIEKKRENRMKAKIPQQPETYQSLLEKENRLSEQICRIETQLYEVTKAQSKKAAATDEDSLESFMKELKQSKPDKQSVSKLKSELLKLKSERAGILKLVNIARPADLPPLVREDHQNATQLEKNSAQKAKLPIFGKRIKIKVQLPARPNTEEINRDVDNEDVEEESESDMEPTESLKVKQKLESAGKGIPVSDKDTMELSIEELEKRRKKNQRRIQSRHERAEMEKLKGYQEDALKEDYNMWVPPEGQSGDGRTSLNDKLGY